MSNLEADLEYLKGRTLSNPISGPTMRKRVPMDKRSDKHRLARTDGLGQAIFAVSIAPDQTGAISSSGEYCLPLILSGHFERVGVWEVSP